MKVAQLAKILSKLDQRAYIDIASDEEGNSYGDIAEDLAEGEMLKGGKVYSLYPVGCEQPEDRYKN